MNPKHSEHATVGTNQSLPQEWIAGVQHSRSAWTNNLIMATHSLQISPPTKKYTGHQNSGGNAKIQSNCLINSLFCDSTSTCNKIAIFY